MYNPAPGGTGDLAKERIIEPLGMRLGAPGMSERARASAGHQGNSGTKRPRPK